MSKLILLRHFQSQWNLENRFTGWVDVPLAKNIGEKVKEVSQKISVLKIDKIYSSNLFRNKDSVAKVLETEGKHLVFISLDKGKMRNWGGFSGKTDYVPVYVSDLLNERYYGQWQGRDKDEIKEEYGEEDFKLLRRSFSARPPGGESLKDVSSRAVHFLKSFIERDLKEGKNVLAVVSHNCLRALAKHIEKISDKDIADLEIDVGKAVIYEFDDLLTMTKKESV